MQKIRCKITDIEKENKVKKEVQDKKNTRQENTRKESTKQENIRQINAV